jgi:tetratricopeptide (TPR) repeat protein
MAGYGREEVQRLLQMGEAELRGWVRAGVVSPTRGSRSTLRFSFQDLVVLRTAKELKVARVPAFRIRKALRALHDLLPTGAALSTVHVTAVGDEVVVRDAGAFFAPDSGQLLFDFGVSELRARVEPLAKRALAAAQRDRKLDAEGWFSLGLELDEASPVQAREAYERALALEAGHVEAHVNLGRLLHEAGELDAAAAHYRDALAADPAHAVAAFNLGVVLEDLGQLPAAARAYEAALSQDPDQADAHHNLGHLLERLGQPAAALRHLAAYRRLTR